MKSVAQVMHKLASKFQPEAAAGLETVFQIQIEDGEAQPYSIEVRDQQCQVIQQQHPDPDVTLIMASDTFVEIISGDLGGTSAFLSGRLRAEGNVILATQLAKLFRR